MTDPANDTTPAPDNLFGNTGVSYNTAQLITMACHGIANTVFVAPTPKPAWFDDLNKELLAAQALANKWLNTIGQQVTQAIPAQVINFNSNFNATTAAILQIVKDNPNATGATNPYVVEVKTLIEQTLVPPLQTAVSQIDSVAASLESWGADLQVAHNNLASGATSIQSAETSLQSDIAAMNSAITNLNAIIAGENKAIAYSAAAIAIGLFALIVGIALAPETGGASLVIGGFIGAAGIIGGAVTWGIMQSRINDQFKEIAKDQNELGDDQRQLVALQGLSLASGSAVTNLELASNSLSKLRTQWGVFGTELQDVITQLESAENALSTIVQGVFTTAAQNEWAAASATAQSLLNGSVQVQTQILPMTTPQTKAA